MHFHDLRHTHKTWLIEAHVTPVMIEALLAALQRRWEQYGTGGWDSDHADAELIA